MGPFKVNGVFLASFFANYVAMVTRNGNILNSTPFPAEPHVLMYILRGGFNRAAVITSRILREERRRRLETKFLRNFKCACSSPSLCNLFFQKNMKKKIFSGKKIFSEKKKKKKKKK